MKWQAIITLSVIVWAGGICEASGQEQEGLLKVYSVNKKVSEFPEKEDFSTPEAAYAAINRVMASGEQGAWRRISVAALGNRLPPADAAKREVSAEVSKKWLSADILEVRIFNQRRAVVLADLSSNPSKPEIDKRLVNLEGGRWLNTGQDFPAASLEAARVETNSKFANMMEKPVRAAVADPKAYLKPFVDFLKEKAEDPKALVMRALGEHKLVIMGEIHHRPRYWAFNSSLVTEPEFAERVGVIYMELPAHAQGLVDEFLAGRECKTRLVIEMLQDNLWMGWPDQAMLDFFVQVWIVNQELEPMKRLRIVLVDMERPWSKIKARVDWAQY
ncbi:MAG: hypothetical protein GY869_31590, partial [Planctomycetes bacterium]|nr:hypothetical protein [Planctomycetota bacterium]